MDGAQLIMDAASTLEAVLSGKAELKELMRKLNASFETLVYTRKEKHPMKGKKIGPVKRRVTVATVVSRVSPSGRRALLRVIEDLRAGREPFEGDVKDALKAFKTAARKLESGHVVNIRRSFFVVIDRR